MKVYLFLPHGRPNHEQASLNRMPLRRHELPSLVVRWCFLRAGLAVERLVHCARRWQILAPFANITMGLNISSS